jgi:hypothetical protein
MRTIRGVVSAMFILSWGAGLLAAAPVSNLPIRLSIDLPAQNIDFSDMDLRDENNRPIVAPQIIRRFEDVLNENLNRMLIDNLTPLRRAWLEMANRKWDAFADLIGRARSATQRWFWTVASRASKLLVVMRASANPPAPVARASALVASTNQFLSLAFLLISSTRLLC